MSLRRSKGGKAPSKDEPATKEVTHDDANFEAVDEEWKAPEYLIALTFPIEEPEGEETEPLTGNGPTHDTELALWIKKHLESYGAKIKYSTDDNLMLIGAQKEMRPREWEQEEGVAPSDKVMQVLHIMRKLDTDVTDDEPASIEKLMDSIEEDGRCVLWTLKEHELIDFTPVHDHTIKPSWSLFWRLVSPSGMCNTINDDMIFVGLYYGEEIVYYWQYMTIYSLWLFFATILGSYFEFKPKPDPKAEHFEVMYSVIMVFWTLFFIVHLNYAIGQLNDILDSRLRLPDFDLGVRSGFEGETRTNPETGKIEMFYPAEKRRPKIIIAGFVTLLGLVCAFGLMYFSLNLNGYINPKSVLYLESLSSLAGPGMIFDKDGMICWFGPTLFHCVFVLALNMTFGEIQERLIEWENYRTQEQADRVLASRRFLFEALDCFLPIFYLSVMERELKYLRQEIIALFTFDQVRRIGLETILPLLTISQPDVDGDMKSEAVQAKIQFEYGEKESFDDYLEMVVQMGYIILVPSAVPLAAAFAFFGNFFEIGSDSWRLCNLERRPFPRRTNNGIGFWFTALMWMFYTCVLSNVFTTLLYTDKLHAWFPVLFPVCRTCPEEDI